MAEHRAAAYMSAVALVLAVLAVIPAGNPDFSLLLVRIVQLNEYFFLDKLLKELARLQIIKPQSATSLRVLQHSDEVADCC